MLMATWDSDTSTTPRVSPLLFKTYTCASFLSFSLKTNSTCFSDPRSTVRPWLPVSSPLPREARQQTCNRCLPSGEKPAPWQLGGRSTLRSGHTRCEKEEWLWAAEQTQELPASPPGHWLQRSTGQQKYVSHKCHLNFFSRDIEEVQRHRCN